MIMLISPLIDHDWISYNVTLIMLYPVPLNESWPDCFNLGIVVFMSSEDPDFWLCNYPNQSGGEEQSV